MATQMQLKVLFGRKSHGRLDFEKEKTATKSCLFQRYFLTEKELERVTENSQEEIHSDGEQMRNASAQQGVASEVKMRGSEKQKGT